MEEDNDNNNGADDDDDNKDDNSCKSLIYLTKPDCSLILFSFEISNVLNF
jgi:hypothetical protein